MLGHRSKARGNGNLEGSGSETLIAEESSRSMWFLEGWRNQCSGFGSLVIFGPGGPEVEIRVPVARFGSSFWDRLTPCSPQ